MSDADSKTLPDDDAGSFSVVHSGDEGGARVGVLQTPHGTFETPCFLPVASHGELRNLTFEDAADCGSRLLMVNAWHVFRRAGAEELLKAGGLHGWMGWSHSVMTDSGGYQVYSLRETSRVDDEGVTFLSPEDGKEDQLTPERVIEIQRIIGSDVITVLDECPPYPCSKEAEQAAMERTHLWARRSVTAFQEMPPRYGRRQALWGIVQGGVSEDLRKISVDELSQHPFDGFGIGGLSIGMPPSVMREMTALVCERLPHDKPRHLLGTGLPPAILDGIEDGVDTFDCVLPVRKAERGVAYTSRGPIYYKRHAPRGLADSAIDPDCGCTTCRDYSWEELRRLYRSEKADAARLVAIHNLAFYHQTLHDARLAIRKREFRAYRDSFVEKWDSGEGSAPQQGGGSPAASRTVGGSATPPMMRGMSPVSSSMGGGSPAKATRATPSPDKASKGSAVDESDAKTQKRGPSITGGRGVLHIKVKSNNVIVTFTDEQGQVIGWSTAGRAGFKGARKNSPMAAAFAGREAAQQAIDAGVQRVSVKVKDVQGRSEDVLGAVRDAGIEITSIVNVP